MHSVLSKSQTLRSNPALDRLGMIISFGCAIHCAAMPLIAGALALSGLHWLGDSRLEWAIIAASFTIAISRLFWSYHRQHNNPECLILFSLGASAILIAQFLLPGGTATDSATMAAGGLLIAAAHFRNHRLCSHKHSNNC